MIEKTFKLIYGYLQSTGLQILIFAIILICSLHMLTNLGRKGAKSIPGPFRFPILGSISIVFDFFSKTRRRQLLFKLPTKFGKITQIKFGPFQMILLNEMDVIKEAFSTKGDILSDRIRSITPEDRRVFKEYGVISSDFGAEYKEMKQLTLHSMLDFGLKGKSMEASIVAEAALLVQEFDEVAEKKIPSDFHMTALYKSVSNVICQVVFGDRFDHNDQKFAETIDAIKYVLGRNIFRSRIPIVNSLPSSKKIEREVLKKVGLIQRFIEAEVEKHKESFDANSPRDFIDLCLQKMESKDSSSSIDSGKIKAIIIELFFAGTDTTATTLSWFLLYMIRFPNIQEKCHEEIDHVLGPDGDLSTMSPLKDFPYTVATILEAQRVSAIVPLSVPHRAKQDTTVGGYFVPKNAILFANIHYMHTCQKNWGDPDNFRPERWLDPREKAVVQNPNFIPFSFGKRRCLGEMLAKLELVIFAVSMLSKFNFSMEDPQNPPTLDGEEEGTIYSPVNYKMIVQKRG